MDTQEPNHPNTSFSATTPIETPLNAALPQETIRAADDIAHAHEEGESMTPKKIWRVFWILLFITTIEFAITLYLAPTFHWSSGIKSFVLISLTILKAFYIIAYFMHLKFERLNLIYIIGMPTILILGLIAGLISEGHHWLSIR